jgi:hypothetical protein
MELDKIEENKDGSATIELTLTEDEEENLINIGYTLSYYTEKDKQRCLEEGIKYILLLEIINSK